MCLGISSVLLTHALALSATEGDSEESTTQIEHAPPAIRVKCQAKEEPSSSTPRLSYFFPFSTSRPRHLRSGVTNQALACPPSVLRCAPSYHEFSPFLAWRIHYTERRIPCSCSRSVLRLRRASTTWLIPYPNSQRTTVGVPQ